MSHLLTNIELSDRLYYRFCQLVYENAGISLGDSKRELVRSRLLKRIRTLHLNSFEEYYQVISEADPQGQELTLMLDAISTNKTDFFRENQHFQFLSETVFPALIDQAKRTGSYRLRIWSAGCSSGEEPYTLALVLREALAGSPNNWDAKILASDISTGVLQHAAEGLYEEARVHPVPAKLRHEGFAKETTPKGIYYRVKPAIRQMVTFRRLNLMDPKFPFSGKFDVIFCRNVMIYFDRKTQEELVNKFYKYLHPGGYLLIGHSESLNSINTPFRFVKPTIYIHP
ncbi:MAG TPA: protein-glutamate O-methyltransferase [Candidatus Sumerlaeota bacterium]|nr:protein-glutamate O-methyltransferase [Candidatus Sumerlaeota bacterium]HPS01439.1 protein-glutamate O-methyltransferase [Candidatus Sumerlaeota bacterium]